MSQRTYEIGLRIAIGASRSRIVNMILAHGLGLAFYGVAIALAVTRALSGLLYGVGTADWSTFTAVAALVLALAAFATSLPAWRASRIDPAKSLRTE